MNALKHVVLRMLGAGYRLLARPFPVRYTPYRVAGGQIYLNIQESPTMLLRALGLYERNKVRAVKTLLRPGDTFIDVGVNKGDFTLLAAERVGPRGNVFSFEPEPRNCYWIRRSIALNGYNNVQLAEVAVSSCDGIATLYLGKGSGWHTLLPGKPNRNEGAIEVTTRSLDSVIGHHQVHMIKIDVEGAEMKVLQGATRLLTANPGLILLIDVHPQLGVNPCEVAAFLSDRGFSLFTMKPPFNRPAAVDADTRELLAYRPRRGR